MTKDEKEKILKAYEKIESARIDLKILLDDFSDTGDHGNAEFNLLFPSSYNLQDATEIISELSNKKYLEIKERKDENKKS